MDFVVVAALFGLVLVGLVLVVQGIVGGDPTFKHQHLPLTDRVLTTSVEHPPERHRVRLVVIGVLLMVAAVVIGLVAL